MIPLLSWLKKSDADEPAEQYPSGGGWFRTGGQWTEEVEKVALAVFDPGPAGSGWKDSETAC